jgi:hypothetical protein
MKAKALIPLLVDTQEFLKSEMPDLPVLSIEVFMSLNVHEQAKVLDALTSFDLIQISALYAEMRMWGVIPPV